MNIDIEIEKINNKLMQINNGRVKLKEKEDENKKILENLLKKKYKFNKEEVESKKILANLLKKKYPTVWRIYAEPSEEDYCEHYVNSCYTTKEKAIKSCEYKMWSVSENCRWNYQVLLCESRLISNRNILKMDIPDSNFPY